MPLKEQIVTRPPRANKLDEGHKQPFLGRYSSKKKKELIAWLKASGIREPPKGAGTLPTDPVCPNCDQWQNPTVSKRLHAKGIYRDCYNECARRGMVKPDPKADIPLQDIDTEGSFVQAVALRRAIPGMADKRVFTAALYLKTHARTRPVKSIDVFKYVAYKHPRTNLKHFDNALELLKDMNFIEEVPAEHGIPGLRWIGKL
jgi:hypothetical protein